MDFVAALMGCDLILYIILTLILDIECRQTLKIPGFKRRKPRYVNDEKKATLR